MNTPAQSRRYYQVHKKQRQEYGRAYYQAHKEKQKAVSKAYYQAHKKECQAYQKAYYAGHKAELREWKRTHNYPEAKRAQKHNQRAALNGNKGRHTAAEWREVLARYGGKCVCCGTTERVRRDHVVSISRGGRNDAGNLQPLCVHCNGKKGIQTIDYRPKDSRK